MSTANAVFEAGRKYFSYDLDGKKHEIKVSSRTGKRVMYRYKGRARKSNLRHDEATGNEYIKPEYTKNSPVFRTENVVKETREIKPGASAGIERESPIKFTKRIENLINMVVSFVNMSVRFPPLRDYHEDWIDWELELVDWANEFEEGYEDEGLYYEDIESFVKRKAAKIVEENNLGIKEFLREFKL